MRRKTGKILLVAACAAMIAGLFADPACAQDGRFKRFGGGGFRQQLQQQRQERMQQGGGQGEFGKGKREALREELMKLPPDQRRQRIQELKQKFQERHQERQQAFEDKWGKASPEQRAKFCEGVAQKCASGGSDSPACTLAQKTCAGNRN